MWAPWPGRYRSACALCASPLSSASREMCPADPSPEVGAPGCALKMPAPPPMTGGVSDDFVPFGNPSGRVPDVRVTDGRLADVVDLASRRRDQAEAANRLWH